MWRDIDVEDHLLKAHDLQLHSYKQQHARLLAKWLKLSKIATRRCELRQKKHLNHQLTSTTHQIKLLENKTTGKNWPEFRSLADDTYSKQLQRQTIISNLLQPITSPTFLSNQVCSFCLGEMTESVELCILLCQRCGTCQRSEYLLDQLPAQASEYRYSKSKEYQKYLNQFHIDALNPPYSLISLLYRELSKVHMMLNQKIKPIIIANVLKKHGQYVWLPMVHRIYQLVMAIRVPAFSDSLIGRLCCRFNGLTEADKLPFTYENLTSYFLVLENLPEEASCFKNDQKLKRF